MSKTPGGVGGQGLKSFSKTASTILTFSESSSASFSPALELFAVSFIEPKMEMFKDHISIKKKILPDHLNTGTIATQKGFVIAYLYSPG